MKLHLAIVMIFVGALSLLATADPATPASNVTDYGTIASVDASNTISMIPWGTRSADPVAIPTATDASVLINLNPCKVPDLKEGMWIKLLKRDSSGKASGIIAGEFLRQEADTVVIFKGMPEEFLVYGSDGWYTNTVAGVKFKVQPMGAGKSASNPGTNLRAAKYQEPAGGFVIYFPPTLTGAIVNWEGAKPGANVPDTDGKILINKDTSTASYWNHRKNPGRPEAGSVSGLTELTIRKLPKRP